MYYVNNPLKSSTACLVKCLIRQHVKAINENVNRKFHILLYWLSVFVRQFKWWRLSMKTFYNEPDFWYFLPLVNLEDTNSIFSFLTKRLSLSQLCNYRQQL